jgi:Cu(I)-responsive transcriptional regulator
MTSAMSIGEVSRRSGVPAKTIRYYEDIGLVPPAERAPNGYRVYGDRALHLLRFVKRAREYGFSIEDTAGLLALWRDDARASAEVKALAEQHVGEIERKIAELEQMRATLVHLVHRCHGDDRPDCPILEELAEEEES